MLKINAVIHCDDKGQPVLPEHATQTKYMWFVIAEGQVTDDRGKTYLRSELTNFFLASSADSKKFRKQLYPFTDMGNADHDYGSCRVFVEEWTCPICSTHNRHVDDCPAPPTSSTCRHCRTHLTQDDILEFEGVCQLEINLNEMTSKAVKG